MLVWVHAAINATHVGDNHFRQTCWCAVLAAFIATVGGYLLHGGEDSAPAQTRNSGQQTTNSGKIEISPSFSMTGM